MNWYAESFIGWKRRVQKWHLWFAWYPVYSGEQIFWLENVQRRLSNYSNYLQECEWEYKGENV